MSISRTKHISFHLSIFNRLSDDELSESFSRDGEQLSADEVRQHIQNLKDSGLEYMPCGCAETNKDGSCKGWDTEAAGA